MAKMTYRVVSRVPSYPDTDIEIAPSVVKVGHQWTAATAVKHIQETDRCVAGTTHRILRRRADSPKSAWEEFRAYVMGKDGKQQRTK